MGISQVAFGQNPTISGEITYPGHEQYYPNGEILIDVWQDPTQWPYPPEAPNFGFPIEPPVDFNNPVPYVIDDPLLQAGPQYYVMVSFDEDNTQQPFMPEAEGFWGTDLISGAIDLSGGSVSGINVALQPIGGVGGLIEGTVSSDETVTGDVWVGLFEPTADPNYWDQRSDDILLGNYAFPYYNINFSFQQPFIVDGGGYIVVAFVDENSNGMPDPFELFGMSPPVTVTGGYGNSGDILMTFEAGEGGFSFDFGATGGYAETNFTILDGGPQITMELFIQLHSPIAPGELYEFIHRENWGILDYVGGDYGTFRFSLFNIGEINWQYSPNPGEWHHIAGDYDGVNMNLYWDGELKSTIPVGGNLPSNTDAMRFGEGFDGLADIIRISDVALYQGNNFDPWTQDYSPNSNTFLLYNCDEGSGSQLIDDSGHGHDADITGTPTWDPDQPLAPQGPQLWVAGSGPDYVDLNWDRWPDLDQDFARYELHRNNAGGVTLSDPVVLDESDVNIVSWRDNNVTEGNTYYYKLWMYDQSDFRYETNEVWETPGGVGQGRIAGNISLAEEWVLGQVHLDLWFPGHNPDVDPPDLGQQWLEDPPFSVSYEFVDPGISEGGPYNLRAYFDADNNGQFDEGEPKGGAKDLYVPSSNELTAEDIVLSSQAVGHVEGNIHSDETGSGSLIIGLFEPSNGGYEWDPNYQSNWNATFPSDEFYQFDDPGIYDASGWQVKAFLDQNSSWTPDGNELYGESGQFSISAGSAYNIDFDLNYPPAPQVGVSTDQLRFYQGNTSLGFVLGNVGGGTVYWKIDTDYGSGASGWITSVSPEQGQADGPDEDSVTVTVSPTGSYEEAELVVHGYSDAGMTQEVNAEHINVYLDEWHLGTGKFKTETDRIYLVAEGGQADTMSLFFKNRGNGSMLLTRVESTQPAIFYADPGDTVDFPWIIHPDEIDGIIMILAPPAGTGTFDGQLEFELQNAESSEYTIDFTINVWEFGSVIINTAIIDSMVPGNYDLTQDHLISINLINMQTAEAAMIITLVDGTVPPANPDGDASIAVAPRYWEILSDLEPGTFAADLCFDLSDFGAGLMSGINDFGGLKIFKRGVFGDGSWILIPDNELSYDEQNNTLCAMNQTEFSQWTVGGDSSGTNFTPALPVVTVDLQGISARENDSLVVNIQATAEAGLKELRLGYWIGGDQTPRDAVIKALSGDSYEGVIPAEDVTNAGLIGYVAARDNLGRDIFTDTTEITVKFDSLFIYRTNPQVYAMISVPGDLDNYGIGAALKDELGPYDAKQWRIFRWNDVSSSYAENQGSFSPGAAFWIITREPVSLHAGAGSSTQLMPPYTINLDQGWNQLGTPYNFGNSIGDLVYPAGDIEPRLYEYDGSGYREVNMMDPGKGYWLYAHKETSVTIKHSGPAMGRQMALAQLASLKWHGRLKVSIAGVHDSENIFGVTSNASDSWDEFDRHEPPVIGDYVTLAFDNRDWDERSGLYSRDIRNDDAEGHVWLFLVRTNQEGYTRLESDWSEALPADWEIYLVDRDFGVARDLRAEPEYIFTSRGSETARNFSLVAGPSSFAREVIKDYELVPESYALLQNMPNPFNAVTTIRFSLPEESDVSLVIYDMLGREVTTLVSKESYGPGSHFVLWDSKDDFGRTVSSGIYLCRLTVRKDGRSKFQDVKKLILLK